MKKTAAFLLAVALLAAGPAAAQVRVLTNADVGRPVPLAQRHALTPAEWQSLVAHQFVYVPRATSTGLAPRVVVFGNPVPPQYPLPPTYPLQPSWTMWSGPYVGYGVSVGGATFATPPAVPWPLPVR